MKKLILILLILIFTACGKCKNTQDIEAEKKAILTVMNTQQKGWNRGNWNMYMSGYKKSGKIRFAGKGKCIYGWETLMKNYQKGYPDKSVMGVLTFSQQDITILSSTSALVFGKWHLKQEKDELRGLYTLIWEKTDKGWKIVHDHTSSAD